MIQQPYYDDGQVTIYLGDCGNFMPDLSPESLDLILTDPPFFLPAHISISRRTWPRSLGNLAVMDGYFRDRFYDMRRLLKPTGAFYTFSDATSYAVFLASIYPLYERNQCLVWDKSKGGLGNGWRHAHELILHGALSKTEYTPGFRKDIIVCPVVPSSSRWHASEKPEGVLRAILAAHPPGVVLDPYMGSGSTLVTARNMGWHVIGMDVEEANCAEALRRLQEAKV